MRLLIGFIAGLLLGYGIASFLLTPPEGADAPVREASEEPANA